MMLSQRLSRLHLSGNILYKSLVTQAVRNTSTLQTGTVKENGSCHAPFLHPVLGYSPNKTQYSPKQSPNTKLLCFSDCMNIKNDSFLSPKSIHSITDYKLPTTDSNAISKITILDPELIDKQYRLPTFINSSLEKLTPSLEQLVPKIDPHVHQKAIDEGAVNISKITMPYLVRIRRHKMKKHKLKKFRKRMIFVHRKLSEIKRKKREKKIVEYQKMMAKSAQEFDAAKYVEQQLALARKASNTLRLFDNQDRR